MRRLRRARNLIKDLYYRKFKGSAQLNAQNFWRTSHSYWDGQWRYYNSSRAVCEIFRIIFREPGLNPGIINQLPVYKYKATEGKSEEKKKICAICMDDYKQEEDIMILPCLHQVNLKAYVYQFHNECIVKWFNESKECPVCKNEVKVEEQA